MARLLHAGLFFAFTGVLWVCAVLFWHFPWLLRVAFYAHVTMVFFGLALYLIVTDLVRQLRARLKQMSVAQLAPGKAGLLSRPLYEVLVELNVSVMQPIVNFVRLLVLVFYDLRDKDRSMLLEEMSPEFREGVFQKPAVMMFPWWLQRFILGAGVPPPRASDPASFNKEACAEASSRVVPVEDECTAASSSSSTIGSSGGSSASTAATLPPVTQSVAVDDALQIIKSAEDAAYSSRETPDASVVPQILLGRLVFSITSDLARYNVDAFYHGVVKESVKHVASPPRRFLLRVPWEVVRCTAKVTVFVLRGLLGGATPAGDEIAAAAKRAMDDKKKPVRITLASNKKTLIVANSNAVAPSDEDLDFVDCEQQFEESEGMTIPPEYATGGYQSPLHSKAPEMTGEVAPRSCAVSMHLKQMAAPADKAMHPTALASDEIMASPEWTEARLEQDTSFGMGFDEKLRFWEREQQLSGSGKVSEDRMEQLRRRAHRYAQRSKAKAAVDGTCFEWDCEQQPLRG